MVNIFRQWWKMKTRCAGIQTHRCACVRARGDAQTNRKTEESPASLMALLGHGGGMKVCYVEAAVGGLYV